LAYPVGRCLPSVPLYCPPLRGRGLSLNPPLLLTRSLKPPWEGRVIRRCDWWWCGGTLPICV
jgi:hypothetical protein